MNRVFATLFNSHTYTKCFTQPYRPFNTSLKFRIRPQHFKHYVQFYSSSSGNKNNKSSWSAFYQRSDVKIIIIAGVVGSYFLYDIHQNSNVKTIQASEGQDYTLEVKPPDYAPTHKHVHPYDENNLKLTLYQYQTCPFCCKVRAFLDYYGFTYNIVEVNSVTRKQVKWSKYRKVPFLLVEDPSSSTTLQLKDSSMIVSALKTYINNKDERLEEIVEHFPNIVNEDGKQEILNKYFLMFKVSPSVEVKKLLGKEREWRRWVDDVLVHSITVNVYRTFEESLQTFRWFAKSGQWDSAFSEWEKNMIIYVGAIVMYFISKRVKKKHGIKDDVREALHDNVVEWVRVLEKAGENKGPFMGGLHPNLADLNVYGALQAMQGCQAFEDAIASHAKMIAWFEATKAAVQSHMGGPELAMVKQ